MFLKIKLKHSTLMLWAGVIKSKELCPKTHMRWVPSYIQTRDEVHKRNIQKKWSGNELTLKSGRTSWGSAVVCTYHHQSRFLSPSRGSNLSCHTLSSARKLKKKHEPILLPFCPDLGCIRAIFMLYVTSLDTPSHSVLEIKSISWLCKRYLIKSVLMCCVTCSGLHDHLT